MNVDLFLFRTGPHFTTLVLFFAFLAPSEDVPGSASQATLRAGPPQDDL